MTDNRSCYKLTWSKAPGQLKISIGLFDNVYGIFFFLIFFIKAFVVGNHLNHGNCSNGMYFHTTYAFLK